MGRYSSGSCHVQSNLVSHSSFSNRFNANTARSAQELSPVCRGRRNCRGQQVFFVTCARSLNLEMFATREKKRLQVISVPDTLSRVNEVDPSACQSIHASTCRVWKQRIGQLPLVQKEEKGVQNGRVWVV